MRSSVPCRSDGVFGAMANHQTVECSTRYGEEH